MDSKTPKKLKAHLIWSKHLHPEITPPTIEARLAQQMNIGIIRVADYVPRAVSHHQTDLQPTEHGQVLQLFEQPREAGFERDFPAGGVLDESNVDFFLSHFSFFVRFLFCLD